VASPGAPLERQRLTTRLLKLADLCSWGDIEEADYRKGKGEAEAALAAFPAPDDVQAVVALLVERVNTQDQRVVLVIPTGPARPFFDAARTDSVGGTGAPGRIRTADASLRTAALYPLSYGGADLHRTGRGIRPDAPSTAQLATGPSPSRFRIASAAFTM
jgi:hypothetical protein